MATKVFNEEEVTLQDDTDVTLRPLVIGRLRRLMKEWSRFENGELDSDQTFEVFINCSGIALEHEFEDKFAETGGLRGKGKEVLAPKYKEYLEDTLDMDTIYKIMEVCAGMKLNDPNLAAAVARMTEDGTA